MPVSGLVRKHKTVSSSSFTSDKEIIGQRHLALLLYDGYGVTVNMADKSSPTLSLVMR
jgi:hypothetical protein